jgi:hypothetical protein
MKDLPENLSDACTQVDVVTEFKLLQQPHLLKGQVDSNSFVTNCGKI